MEKVSFNYEFHSPTVNSLVLIVGSIFVLSVLLALTLVVLSLTLVGILAVLGVILAGIQNTHAERRAMLAM